jgi:hypothetical protein
MRRLALAFILTVPLIAVGCGDDSGGGGDVSREEYIAQADEFCKKQNAEAEKIGDELEQAATGVESEGELFEKITPKLEEGAQLTKDGVEEFKNIEPPADDQATIDKMYAEMDKQVALLDDIVAAAKDGNTQKFTQIAEEGETADESLNQMANDYGFKECGESDTETGAGGSS